MTSQSYYGITFSSNIYDLDTVLNQLQNSGIPARIEGDTVVAEIKNPTPEQRLVLDGINSDFTDHIKSIFYQYIDQLESSPLLRSPFYLTPESTSSLSPPDTSSINSSISSSINSSPNLSSGTLNQLTNLTPSVVSINDQIPSPSYSSNNLNLSQGRFIPPSYYNNNNLTSNNFVANNLSPRNNFVANNLSPRNNFVANNLSPRNNFVANNLSPRNNVVANNISPRNNFVANNLSPRNNFVANNLSPRNNFVANNLSPRNNFVANNLSPRNTLSARDDILSRANNINGVSNGVSRDTYLSGSRIPVSSVNGVNIYANYGVTPSDRMIMP